MGSNSTWVQLFFSISILLSILGCHHLLSYSSLDILGQLAAMTPDSALYSSFVIRFLLVIICHYLHWLQGHEHTTLRSGTWFSCVKPQKSWNLTRSDDTFSKHFSITSSAAHAFKIFGFLFFQMPISTSQPTQLHVWGSFGNWIMQLNSSSYWQTYTHTQRAHTQHTHTQQMSIVKWCTFIIKLFWRGDRYCSTYYSVAPWCLSCLDGQLTSHWYTFW